MAAAVPLTLTTSPWWPVVTSVPLVAPLAFALAFDADCVACLGLRQGADGACPLGGGSLQ